MDFKSELKETKVLIDNALKDYFELQPEDDLNCNLAEFTLRGGKRIRSVLFYKAYEFFSNDFNQEIALNVCIAIELLQSYFLIHDDVMDKDEMRRGKKTIHAIYRDDFIAKGFEGDAAHYGNSMAILVGDLANHKLFDILANTHPDLVREMNKWALIVLRGQKLDVNGSFVTPTKDLAFEIYRNKTAAYTFQMPLHLAATLSGTQPFDIDEYALSLGIAFQIQDDLLDFFGVDIGKDNASDITEGKTTLLVCNALEKNDELENYLGKELTAEDKMVIEKIFIETGAKEKTTQTMHDYFQKSKDAIINYNKKEFFEKLVEYVESRSY